MHTTATLFITLEPPEVAPRDPEVGENQVDDAEISEILAEGKHDIDTEIETETEAEHIPRAESPAVPPPTYRWEEIRRQKMAGLYPWTHLYKRPLDQLNGNLSDHEYEPISPPQARAVVPALSVTDIEGVTMQEPPAGPDSEPIMSDDSSGSPTRAVPVDVNVRVPYDGDEEVRTMGEDSDHDLDPDLGRDEKLGPDGDLEEDDVLTAQQYQDEMEAQFFNVPSMVSTPSTAQIGGPAVESQTSAESQMDSSQPSQSGSGIPQRLRAQAGRIKTKLRSINRPKLPTMPRPKRPNISFAKFSRSCKKPNTSSSDSNKEGKSPKASKENQPPKEQPLSSESTAGSTKNIFNFSTYPRVLKKIKRSKSVRSTTSPEQGELESSIDSAPRRKSIGQRWIEKVREIKFADEDPEEKRKREKEREERREKELHERYLKQRERRESKEREKEQKELERIRKENEKYVKRMSVDISHAPPFITEAPSFVSQAPSTTTGKKSKGDALVYHVSLHGSDSEPDYSDGPFPGPPYPEISDEELGLALLTKPRSEGPSRSQSAMDMDNSLQDYSRDQSVDPGTGQDTPASPGDSDRENRSSGTSSERHRRGVLEEIDSDEFFLRQKGISQEDVEMGRFISSEIRDALRAPDGTRDWSRIEYADDDDEEEEIEERYPKKKATAKTVQSTTLPPSRPSRTRTFRPWRQGRKIPPTPPGDEPEGDEDEEEEPVQQPPADPSSYYKTFPPSRPKRTGKPKKKPVDEPQPEFEDEMDFPQEFQDIGPENEAPEVQQRFDDSVAIFSEDFGILAPSVPVKKEPPPRPQPPKRLRKSMTSLERDRNDDTLFKEDWQSNMSPQEHEVIAMNAEADYIIPPPPEPPVPPARRRPRSRATSQADEDRTSRGAESLPSERDIDIVDIDVVDIDENIIDDQANNRGRAADSYALVSKQQSQQRPRRSRSSKTLAAPGRRKRNQQGRLQNWRQFFSLPRRSKKQTTTTTTTTVEPPVRPMRNYSTLGPARPPRRNSRQSREHLYVEDDIEIKTELQEPEAEAESAIDLQSSEITFKMKDRPLPAPPRPPRKSRECVNQEEEGECHEVVLPDHIPDDVPQRRPSREEHKAALAGLRDDFFSRSRETPPPEEPPVPCSPTGEELQPVFEAPYKSLRKKKKVPPVPTDVESTPAKIESVTLQSAVPPEEVSIAIQTDPLPDDFCVEESMHHDEQSLSQFEPTTETVTTETWPTVIEVDATIAEDLPSMTTSSTTESKPEVSAPPPIPPRLHVSDLDINRLNVSELQAHRLTVSEIDSATLSTSEFSAQAGSLSLSSGELPNTLARAVADAVQSALSGVNEALSRPLEIVQQQHELQQQMRELQELQQLHQHQSEQSQQLVLQQLQAQLQQLASAEHAPPPVPPPPPSYSIQTQTSLKERSSPLPDTPSYSIQTQTSLAEAPVPPVPPASSIQTQTSLAESPAPPVPPSLTESELQSLYVTSSPPPPPPRRVRTPIPAESEDSEEFPSRSHASSRRRRTHSSHSSQPTEEHDVVVAGRQLASACRSSLIRALNTLYASIEPTLTAALSDGEANAKRRELQAALCLVLIVAAAMVILGCGCMGSKVQHHHWDFHLPPPL